MRKHLIAALACCALFPGPLQAQDQQACSLKRVTDVDLLREFAPMAAIPITVNGTKIQVLIDTAGILSGLSADAVKKLNLSTHIGDIAEVTVSGRSVAQTTRVDAIQIGAVSGSSFEFMVDPSGFTGNLDGRISPDILRGYDVDFDFANNKMNLFAQDHCPGRVVYWTTSYAAVPMTVDRMGHIVIRVDLDGETLDAVVDTGAAQSTVSETIASRAFHLSAGSPGATPVPDAPPDSPVQYRYAFKALTMNGVTVNNPIINVASDRAEQTMRAELGKLADDPNYGLDKQPRLIIGMDVLRHLHLYIAYKEHMLYVSGASAH